MKNITIENVKPGMILAQTVINDNFIVVLAENTLLSSAHITRLQFLGIKDVYIKDEYDLNPQKSIVESMLSRSHSFLAEYQEILGAVEKIFIKVEREKSVPIKDIKKIVSTLQPMAHQSGAIEYLYKLKASNNATYNHSLRVSILSGVLAKWLNYSKKKIADAVLAGFLHDIGKTQLDQKVIKKNIENLSEEEKKIYIQHPLAGYHMIAEDDEISGNVKCAVLQHHESMDGTGFPLKSSAEDIDDFAKIIAVVDLYDNITTEREGFKKQTPFHALERITKDMYTTLDPAVVYAFIINVQQSFIGSEVILSDKRKGIVTYYPNDYAAMPLIRLNNNEIINLNDNHSVAIVEYTPVDM